MRGEGRQSLVPTQDREGIGGGAVCPAARSRSRLWHAVNPFAFFPPLLSAGGTVARTILKPRDGTVDDNERKKSSNEEAVEKPPCARAASQRTSRRHRHGPASLQWYCTPLPAICSHRSARSQSFPSLPAKETTHRWTGGAAESRLRPPPNRPGAVASLPPLTDHTC